VIQHILDFGSADERASLISSLRPHLFTFALHKYASNVVERVLMALPAGSQRKAVLEEVGGLAAGDTNEQLEQMMRDQFGNYVVARMLDVVDSQVRNRG
jgi:pumilio RNA-binding family